MWSKLTSRVANKNVDTLLGRADVFISSFDNKESLNWDGKDFFQSKLQEDNNQDLLRLFHLDIWPEISDIVDFNVPVIDHASLLVKSAGAAGTTLHQDRPYWFKKEALPTIFSVWIALEDMSKEKGGLILSPENQVDVNEMSSFNTESTLEHEDGADPEGGFPYTIPAPIASRMTESMEFISLAKGEAIAFDSFEPHMTGPNITRTPRLAMKIAYGEGKEKAKYLARTEALEC